MAHLLRILVVGWLLIGLSGATPVLAGLAEERVECCADDPVADGGEHRDEGGDSGAETCPPTCDDCVCRTASVVLGLGAVGAVPSLVELADPPRESSQAITQPPLRGVFRPPRAHA